MCIIPDIPPLGRAWAGLQYSHTLVAVAPLLEQVQLRLIAHKEFMAAVLETDALSVELVAVAQADAVEIATEEQRHAIGGAVGHSSVEHALLV